VAVHDTVVGDAQGGQVVEVGGAVVVPVLDVVGVDPPGGAVAVGEPAALVADEHGVADVVGGEADAAAVVDDPTVGQQEAFHGGAGPEDGGDRFGVQCRIAVRVSATLSPTSIGLTSPSWAVNSST